MSVARTCVVCGVGPGLGAALARRWAKEGYKVALCGRTEANLKPVQDELEKSFGAGCCDSFPLDCGDFEAVAKVFGDINAKFGAPEVLIYNVGPSTGSKTWPPPAPADIEPDLFMTSLRVGAGGGFACAKAVIPEMEAAGKGTILFTGATASLRSGARFVTFAPAKFALRAVAQSLAREYQPKGIHVASINIDGQILSSRAKDMFPDRPEDSFLNPDAIADTYWMLHAQDKTAWSHETEVRPYVEKF
eukprot:Clim_evm51s88 gene=Clim_evmTU51s88